MPKTSEMFPSRFLKEADVAEGQLWTIKKVAHEEVGRGNDAEMKYVMYFQETAKCLTLNKTNTKRAEKALGSDNTDDWVGKKIVVYFDPDVEFGGEQIGGIRLRGPKVEKEAKLPF